MDETEVERFEQVSLAVEAKNIDREAGILRDVLIVGRKSRTDGVEYSDDAHNDACSRFEQLAVGIDHDFSGKPLKVADTWGVVKSPRRAEDGVRGDLAYIKSHVRTEQILEDASRGIGLFSLSMVAKCVEKAGKVIRYIPSRVDLVTRGATTRTLFNQGGANGTVLNAEFEALKTRVEQLDARLKIKESMQPAAQPTPAAPV